jgi:PHD/YefM family antitoxin component YafN of YafNO toxin-antitoxin module
MSTKSGTGTTMPVTKLRKELMHLPELLDKSEQVTVTSRGHPVATIVSFTFYTHLREELERARQEMQAMQETIEILQDAELMEDIREGMKALQSGDTVSLEEARRALGME